MKKAIKGIFLTGIAATVPIGVTIYVLVIIVGMMDSLIQFIPPRFHPDRFLPFHVPGLGILFTVLFIFVVGLITRSYLGNRFVALGEWLVNQIPFVRSIYKAVKKFIEALFGDRSMSFRRVVLIEYPRTGLYCIAFVTGVARGEVQQKTSGMVLNLFVPTTPNPTSGFYLMVPESDVVNLNMTVEDAFTLIISGGMISPPEAMSVPRARKQPSVKEGENHGNLV